jgi:AcrR family transcriptional regulator
VDRVAQAAAVTSGAFYGHFSSKEQCLAAVVEHAIAANEANRERGLESLSGEAWLEAMLRRYLSAEHWRAVSEGCPIPTLISELPRCGPAPRRAFSAAVIALIDRMRDKAGVDEEQIDVLMAALSMAVGAMALARAVDDEGLGQQFLNAASERGTTALINALTSGDRDAG